jgi:hypothetical protein
MKTLKQSSQRRHLQEPWWNGVLFHNAPVVAKKARVYWKQDYEEHGANAKTRLN